FEANEWRAEDYISFVTKFMLGMGLSFQLPVVLLTLVKIELLDYQKLSGFRSYWVVINMVLCAVITPSGDPVTMMLMALPLQVLYEVSVFIARIWARQERAALSANNSPPHAD
ncbi:MAG: twin-arginine translocase subunit TatC, partial [Verrucomicrobia bacterium]|nr:twin-arginine translocase subunit TatC [Verrucomicrobiota bacterium]